jgi:hypothetical protein
MKKLRSIFLKKITARQRRGIFAATARHYVHSALGSEI